MEENNNTNNILSDIKPINPNTISEKIITCEFCNKNFKKTSNLNRHQKLYCTLKINNTLLEEFKSIKSDLKGVNKITEFVKNLQQPNTIVSNNNNNNNINNTINIQVNNVSKQKKLNQLLQHVLDIDTFTENYKNGEEPI